MASDYRYWCGECRHRSPWHTESAGAEAHLRHYLERHPGIDPGGQVEFRGGKRGGGCLTALVALAVLTAILVSTFAC